MNAEVVQLVIGIGRKKYLVPIPWAVAGWRWGFCDPAPRSRRRGAPTEIQVKMNMQSVQVHQVQWPPCDFCLSKAIEHEDF